MDLDLYNIPDSIRDYIELCGLEATMGLVAAFGGRQIVVPVGRVKGATRAALVRAMGVDAAELFMKRYGGEYLTVAKCAAALRDIRDRQIVDDFNGGMSAARLAEKYGMCERNIKYRLKRVPGDALPGLADRPDPADDQLPLF